MDYKIISKKNITILTVLGSITKEDREKLSSCSNEIQEIKEIRSLIIYFKNVPAVDTSMYRDLTMLQHEIRKKNIHLRLLGLTTQLKNLLNEKGIIRSNELGNNLDELINQLSNLEDLKQEN